MQMIQASADYNRGFTAPYLSAPFDGARRTIWRQTHFGAKLPKLTIVAPVAPKLRMAVVF